MKLLAELAEAAYKEGRRLVVPLLGFPGVQLTGTSIKLAQQNYQVHFKTLKALVATFSPDMIFPLMDLSVEANALGRLTHFPVSDSASVPRDRFHFEELDKLRDIDLSSDGRVHVYVETVKLMRIGLPGSVLRGAYVIGPYTLTSLIVGAEEAAVMAVEGAADLHRLSEFAAAKIQEYAKLLIAAGAEVVCVLEPSAVMLGPRQFEEFSGAYVAGIRRVCAVNGSRTIYHICGNSMHLIEKIAASGVDGISLDSSEVGVDLIAAVRRIPGHVVVLGNVNPVKTMLLGGPENVRRDVRTLLSEMRPFPNFILSTGCDLPQQTPLENIHAFMEEGRSVF